MRGQNLLSADVAGLLGITPAAVRQAAVAGRLRVAAITPKGVRLFRPADVEDYRRLREAAQGKNRVRRP